MKDHRLASGLYGFVGAATFWALAHSGTAVAQVSGSVASFLKVQAVTPGTAQTGNANLTGTLVAGQLQGDGSGVSNLNASNLASGTVPDSRLTVGGDLTGPLSNSKVTRIQGKSVASTSPLSKQVLAFNGSNWAPADDGIALPYSKGLFTDGITLSSMGGTALRGTSTSNGAGVVGAFGESYSGLEQGVGVLGYSLGGTAIVGTTGLNGGTAGYFVDGGNTVRIRLVSEGKAIRTNGFLYHDYSVASPFPSIPIAYGCINSTGTIAGGTGNFTVTHTGTGLYTIEVSGETYSNSNFAVTVTPVSSSPKQFGVVNPGGGPCLLRFWDSNNNLSDTQFQFTIWTTSPAAPG